MLEESSLGIIFNKKPLHSNEFVAMGDVISVLDKDFNLSKNLNKYSENNQIFSFVEVDYYAQSVVVLKNVESLSEDDLNLLLIDSLGLSTLS